MNKVVKKRLIIGALTLLVLSAAVVVLVLLMNREDKKYWESEGATWKRDCTFLSIEDTGSFEPEKIASKDQRLIDSSAELLQNVIDGKPFESDYISIDKEQTERLSADSRKYFDRFYVIQKGDKAVVSFRFSGKETDLKEAEENCLKSYKTYPYDKIYLENTGGKWKVTDTFRQA